MIFIIMDSKIKAIDKLINKLVLPKYDDIIEFEITRHPDDKLDILFWMDGTDQEIEEEIVDEVRTALTLIGTTKNRITIKFTTEGEHFYDYN